MSSAFIERLRQGHRTMRFPPPADSLPERFRGRPEVDGARCPEACRACVEICPTQAVSVRPLRLDLGACLFCGHCQAACPSSAIHFTRDHQLAAGVRQHLVLEGSRAPAVAALPSRLCRLLGRSLKLRQVSAGGCGGCEAELAALGNVVFDLGRFGVQFVASPRHADGVVVTGPVTANMELALRETWSATPGPKIAIAVGACAISGGLFAAAAPPRGGMPGEIQVALYVPGCPPHPLTLLDGLLRLQNRLPPHPPCLPPAPCAGDSPVGGTPPES